jgi:predicted double-glycine peptidase
MKLIDKVNIKGTNYNIYKLTNSNKQLLSVNTLTGKKVYFGDPNMKEYPGTKRGDNYCSRSLGIANKFNIKEDTNSPNFWSRWYLWNCKGNKSLQNRPKL